MADCDYEVMDPSKPAATVAGAHKVSGLAVGCQEVVDSRGLGILGMVHSTGGQHF